MKLRILAAFLLSCIATAFALGETNRIAQFFKTPENLQIVSMPERVGICILRPDIAPGEKTLSAKYLEGPYKSVSPETAKILSSLLSSESAYIWDGAKGCMPQYNARVRFHKDGHIITADLYFGCKILELSRDGKSFAGEDFDPINSQLFGIVRELFPDDKVILSIIAEDKRLEEWKRTRSTGKN
jgi:hypothetical protein